MSQQQEWNKEKKEYTLLKQIMKNKNKKSQIYKNIKKL